MTNRPERYARIDPWKHIPFAEEGPTRKEKLLAVTSVTLAAFCLFLLSRLK